MPIDITKYHAEDGGVLEAWLDIHKDNCMYVPDYKEWYTWNGKHWEPDRQFKIRLSIANVMKSMNNAAREKLQNTTDDDEKKMWQSYIIATKRSDNRISSVDNMARAYRSIDSREFDSLELLNLQNGTLDLVTFILMPHDPENKLTYCLDYDYDETAKSPAWNKAIMRFGKEVVDFYQEFCGYSLTPNTHYEIAVWLKGKRGGGKSTLIHGIQIILGPRAWVLSLANLQQSQFALAGLPGKTLAVATEQPSEYVKCSDTLNTIISGEPLLVDIKFKNAITITPICKLLWAMNDYPTISNPGDGLYRRIKVIEVPQLNKAIIDPDLRNKIENEKAGILNWAIQGLRRLQARGRFEVPDSIDQSTRDFELENDIVGMFVDEMCQVDFSKSVQSSVIYYHYAAKDQWCDSNGYKAKSMVKFARDLQRIGFKKKKDSTGNMRWYGLDMAPTLPNPP
jgi:putative DNA primase/helicase